MNKYVNLKHDDFRLHDDHRELKQIIKENESLKSIINSLNEGVIVADKDGKFLYFNPMAEDILGIGLQDVTSTQWSTVYGTFYPDKITPYPSEKLPLAIAIKGRTISNELIFIRNPKRPKGVFIEVSANPLRNAKGVIHGGVIIIRDVTSIKQAELAQRQSEERVQAQFKGFPIPTYVWQYTEDDFILVDFNTAADVFTRGNIRRFLGLKISEIYADSPDIQEDFLKCYRQKKSISRAMMSYRLRTTDENKEMIFSYVYIPPDLILLHTEDITEQKKNAELLKRLSNAVEQTADSVIISKKDGVIEYVNPAFEETTGYSRQEAIGKTPNILQSGMHDKKFYTELWKVLLSGKPFRGTIINKKKNGENYWTEQTITPMKDEAGNITNYVSVLKDITDLKQKQEQEFQLRIAQELQHRLYKANISVPGFDIAGATYSAVETNGDYFDFIHMADGSIGMVVGDVSGHGIGAAMIMVQTRAFLRAFAKKESDPGLLMSWLNEELVDDLDPEHYVTLILARLDPKKNMLDYVNAGHPQGYLLNGSGDVRHIMESTGIPVGILKDYPYVKSEPIHLMPEDIAFFLTDGVTEAQTVDDIEFGFDRTLKRIQRHQKETARQIMDRVYKAVRSFTKNLPLADDITTIVCKVLPVDSSTPIRTLPD